MSSDLDPLLKTLNLANTRKSWQQLVARAEKEDWPYDQFLQVLLSEELAHRRATRLAKASRAADFPFLRTIEEFDFTFQSTLRLTSIGSLLSPDFVVEGRSVILFGKPGRGKTHLAIAIAYRAIQCGFEALFTTAAEMIEDLSTASRDGRLREALVRYVRPHVLVVDEVGYLAYGPDAANVLYHVVNDRHVRKRAMIFTTNKDPKRQWGAVLHDDDLAEAIVDRVLERGRLLRLDGPSVRTKHLPPDELGADDKVTSSSSRVSGTYKLASSPAPTAYALREVPRPRRLSRGAEHEQGATQSPAGNAFCAVAGSLTSSLMASRITRVVSSSRCASSSSARGLFGLLTIISKRRRVNFTGESRTRKAMKFTGERAA